MIILFQETGWSPRHIVAVDETGNVVGVVPLYLKRSTICSVVETASPHVASSNVILKLSFEWSLCLCLITFTGYDSHSYGEFVFDHSWADAYYSYGSRYYPKFQCCVPFTPVTGPRILLRDSSYKAEVFDIIASTLKDLVVKVYSTTYLIILLHHLFCFH